MSNENYYHIKGQKDRAGKKGYREPNSFLGGAFNTKKETGENKAYKDGWRNANKTPKKR
jgi:hypothetical protein